MKYPTYRTKTGLRIGEAYVPPNPTRMDEHDELIQKVLLGIYTPWYHTWKLVYAYIVFVLVVILMVKGLC